MNEPTYLRAQAALLDSAADEHTSMAETLRGRATLLRQDAEHLDAMRRIERTIAHV